MPVPSLPQRAPTHRSDAVSLAAAMQPTQQETVGAAVVLAIAPNDPFFLRHHPGNWRISTALEGGPFWLPEVTPHVLSPGVNGVRTRDKSEPVEAGYRNSVRDGEDRGWLYLSPQTQIPADCLPPGVPAGGYLRDVACQDPVTLITGRRYLEAWQVPADTVPDEEQRFRFHHPSYERWLKWLVESGLIAPMPDYVADRLRERYRGRLDRAMTLNVAPDLRALRVRQQEEIVRAHEAARQLDEPPAALAPPIAPPVASVQPPSLGTQGGEGEPPPSRAPAAPSDSDASGGPSSGGKGRRSGS